MEDVKYISKLYFFWIVSIFILFYFGIQFVFPSLSPNFLGQFANWDGHHYLTIAEFGYYRMQEYAFFPLYPLLIKITTYLSGSFLLSGIVINVVCAFLGFLFLYKLMYIEVNKEIAFKTILLLFLFPTSFFFVVVYSEALFFLFTILTFYSLKKEKYFLAALFSGLATATRPLGLAVAAAVFYQLILLTKKKQLKYYMSWMRVIGLSIFSVSGIIFYMAFLFFESSSPFSFLTAQSNWNRNPGLPWEGILLNILNIIASENILLSLSVVWEFLFAVFGLGIVLRSFRFLPTHYSLYALISLLLPLTTSSLMSFPRFLLPIFPLFMVLSLIRNRLTFLTYGIVSTALLIYFSILFINGFWVS